MIITRIHAENILKYTSLDLGNIPKEGLIAISGENEVGKSTIGEIICFILFGRTFSHDYTHLQKVIRWGESHCSGAVDFQQGNNHYRIARFLDSDGNHSAKLTHLATGQTLASGNQTVNDALHTLVGYNFESFIHSFYLAQREITAPHPQSEIIKIMAGVSTLEEIMREIKSEISKETEEIISAEQRIAETSIEIGSIPVNKENLCALHQQYASESEFLTALQHQATELETANQRYLETVSQITKIQIASNLTRFLRNILLLLVVALAGSGMFCVWFFDNSTVKWAIDSLYQVIQPRGASLRWALPYFSGTLLLLLFLFLLDGMFQWRIHRFKEARTKLVDALRRFHRISTEYHALGTEEIDATKQPCAINIPEHRPASLQAIERPTNTETQRIVQLIADNTASQSQTKDLVSRSLTWLNTLSSQYRDIVFSRNLVIADEERKLRVVQQLEAINTRFRSSVEEHRKRIAVRQLSHELLHGACGRMVQRFNRDVRELMGTILPMFTDNHYQYLRIDNNLTVQIFSVDKQDFMDLDEVSSGTQRQAMLALRITLAQQLLDRTKGMPQFLFLDEPFAFFDETRTRHALTALPKLSGNLKQIWVVAQTFPESVKTSFSSHIECRRQKELAQTKPLEYEP